MHSSGVSRTVSSQKCVCVILLIIRLQLNVRWMLRNDCVKVLVASTTTSPYLDVRILTRITVGDTATRTMLQQAHPAKDPYPWIWMQPTCNPEMQMQMQIVEIELGICPK